MPHQFCGVGHFCEGENFTRNKQYSGWLQHDSQDNVEWEQYIGLSGKLIAYVGSDRIIKR